MYVYRNGSGTTKLHRKTAAMNLYRFIIVTIPIIHLFFTNVFADGDRADTAHLYSHVFTLVNTPEPRNFEHIDMLDSVARYIAGEFRSYGYGSVTEQTYDVKGNTCKNVIASIGPESTEVIVIGAHYDVCGPQPGADDNASGVAGLLECARLLYDKRDSLRHRIEFAAYSLEEPPFFGTRFMGSYIHASSLADNAIKVKLMICLEMIGYFSNEKKSQSYPLGIMKPFYGSKGDYIACVSNFSSGRFAKKLDGIFNRQTTLRSIALVAPGFLTGIDFSDHRNYWGYKMKALMITDSAFYRNRNYHTTDDTVATLNFEKMAQVVNGTVSFVLQL